MNDRTIGPLHQFLIQNFPTLVDAPFSDNPTIHVYRMAEASGFSANGVYKWIKTNRLSSSTARKLVDLASEPKNLAALKALGRTPPQIKDFADFVL